MRGDRKGLKMRITPRVALRERTKKIIYIFIEAMKKDFKTKYESCKKSQEAITRFEYCKQEMIPGLFPDFNEGSNKSNEVLRSANSGKKMRYFYGEKRMEGSFLVDEESILHSIKSVHLENGDAKVLKINNTTFRKIAQLRVSFLSSTEVDEILEFMVKKGEGCDFELFILHHCHPEGEALKWLNFVEKYTFSPQTIHYSMIASCLTEPSFFPFTPHATLEAFIRSCFQFQKLQGHLLQYQDRVKHKIKASSDPAFSEEHRKCKKIPPEFLKAYYALRKEFGEEKEKDICRFYFANEFNYEVTKQGLKSYYEWREEFVAKYKWEDFEQFHARKIFRYLGEDFNGLPVIINYARNVKVNEMDLEKYCDFYMYFMEIFIPSKMRGHVSQINIIADVEEIGADNFKLATTRRNIADGVKYCAERQYKFFAVNVNMFAYYCWKFIKPLLPKRTVEKIFIGGNNMEEITESLLQEMPPETIPVELGGQNPVA